MSIEIYKDEDLIPLTVSVLFKLGFCHAVFTLKFIIENVYPDLKGKIATDDLHNGNVELINSFEAEPMTYDAALEIEKTFVSLANIYGLDVLVIIHDERLGEMANDFYWNTVIDEFPRDDDDQSEEERVASPGNLELYAMSMLNALNFLCHMLCQGKVDFDNSWTDGEFFYTNFLYEDYSNEQHAVALKMLQDLGELLQQVHLDTLDLTAKYGNKKWR